MAVAETEEKPEVAFHILGEKMKLVVSCTVTDDNREAIKDVMRSKMRLMDVAKEALTINLDAWLDEAAKDGPQVEKALLYEGLPPVPTQDGKIEWGGDFFNDGFVIDEETGTIDFRQRAAQVTVEEGQLIATLIPPVPGQEGRDIYGNRVKVLRPEKPRIRPGKNIRKVGEETYYASCAGRIRRDGTTVHIDDVYRVPGDVGLKTGDINHPGAVVVEGDITEGSRVVAGGDIEVFGIIEKANVKTNGNLTVHGGIVGEGDYRVEADGGIQARYLSEATVSAGGDVVVEKEIVQSRLRCSGMVHIPQGRIVGGEVFAHQGIEVAETGSEANVQTKLIIGRDPEQVVRLQELEAKLGQLEQAGAKIRYAVSPLAKRIKELPPEKVSAVKKLLSQLKEIGNESEKAQREIDGMQEEAEQTGQLKVVILNLVHPETSFSIEWDTLRLRKVVRGPVKAIAHERKVRLTRDRSKEAPEKVKKT